MDMETDKSGFLDIMQEKIVSRKLVVFTTATIAFFMGNLPSDDWVSISLAYVGVLGFIEAAKLWKAK